MSSDRHEIRAGRGLLFPGPQPPLSHFGLTLQRHVVATGLRYALYQLGLPPPDRPPVSVVQLRLYLDAAKLRKDLEGVAGRGEVVGALLEPGGSGRLGAEGKRVAAAAALHRIRQRLLPRRRIATGRVPRLGNSRRELWEAFRDRLSTVLPVLNEALLSEVLAALSRRAERSRGRPAPLCTSVQSRRLLAGGRARLKCLGSADPLFASWAEVGVPASVAERRREPIPPLHPGRGRFRETYRRALDELRRPYLALAARAVEKGWIERADDAFFFPFDLAEDLTGDRRPGWLASAVASNRREYESLLEIEGPPELLKAKLPETRSIESNWDLAPLSELA
jgi:hypothetical protein